MNKEYKDFVEFAHSKYFAIKHRHADDDWEQEYFDVLNAKFNTETTQVLAQMFYWDDDTAGEIAWGVLDMLNGKKLLRFDCFDDEENETTIVVAVIDKSTDKQIEMLEEIQSICIGADSPDAIEHGERDPLEELQCCREDISAISNITEQILKLLGVK